MYRHCNVDNDHLRRTEDNKIPGNSQAFWWNGCRGKKRPVEWTRNYFDVYINSSGEEPYQTVVVSNEWNAPPPQANRFWWTPIPVIGLIVHSKHIERNFDVSAETCLQRIG